MTEAKGSDVRAACEVAAKNLNQAIGVHLLRSDSIGCFTEEQAARVIEKVISPILEARVQAAAVDMRERCAKATCRYCKLGIEVRDGAMWGKKTFIHRVTFPESDRVEDMPCEAREMRAIPIPTNAYDAALLRARIAAIEECAKSVGSFPLSVDEENRGRLVNRLRALTQPAPERK